MAEPLNKEIAQTTREFDRLQRSVEGLVSKLSQVGRAAGGAASATGNSTGGGSMMPTTMGNLPPMPSYDKEGGGFASNFLSAGMAALPGIGQMAGSVIKGGYSMMPKFEPTINRETSYYNSAVMQGGGVRMGTMRSATFNAMRGGLTSAGSDAATSEYLSNRGMAFSSDPNSTYMQTVRGVSNAAKYLNMSNSRAAAAIEGLTSGSMSANLMRQTGIYTSDLSTGKAKGQGQIFSELYSRLTAGRKKVSADMVNESFRRGNLGASLQSLGLSDDQQQMFRQYAVERANGNNMDLSSDSAMAELQKKAGISGNNNPALAGYQSNTFDTDAMNKASKAYIDGMNAAVPAMKTLSDISGQLAQQFGQIKGFLETLSGNNAGGAALGAAGGILGGGMNAVGGVLGTLGMANMLRGGGGGAGSGAGGAGAAVRGLTSTTGASGLSLGGKLLGGASILGGALGAAGTVADIIGKSDQAGQAGILAKKAGMSKADADKAATGAAWGNALGAAGQGAMSGAALGAGIGSFIPGLGTVVGGIAGGAIGGLAAGIGSWFSTYNAQMGGYAKGGDKSTISNSTPTGSAPGKSKVSYAKPINAPMGDKFGPRPSPFGQGGGHTFHHGLDFPAAEGTVIVASADGTVTTAGPSGEFGNYVTIKHADGVTTGYAHQSRIAARVGQTVKQGETIGYVGTTGASTGPHLHFNANRGGGFFDPLTLLGGAGYVSVSGGLQSQTPGSGTTSGGGAMAPDINSIIDSRAKTSVQSVASLSGAGSASSGVGVVVQSAPGGAKGSVLSTGSKAIMTGTSGNNVLSDKSMGIYLPGAPRAKEGDSHVAQDGPVNVHAGEAILTAQQADIWRSALKSGSLGGHGKGNNVTINLTIAQASDDEAKRFAGLVKTYLEDDRMLKSMGSK
jgi:murein DD-endopeptidase MepM/ murein hydrolase activator NlpD